MDWQKGRESDNVVQDDGSGGGGGFGGGGMGFGGFHIGIGGIILIIIGSLIFHQNPLNILSMVMGGGGAIGGNPAQYAPSTASPGKPVDDSNPETKFVKVILASTEDVWGAYFQASGQQYQRPKLELFNGRVRTACGAASEAMGPFYCPGDRRVYLDLGFFQEMDTRFHAQGDFARAYVIAHEVGHHVQNLIGIMDKEQQAQRAGQPMDGATGLSVRLELQADCFAGVWANRSQKQMNWINQNDIDSALNAASAVGDDTLQKQAQGYAVPDSFTHGTSTQRQHWFKAGFATGDINSCDTFGASTL